MPSVQPIMAGKTKRQYETFSGMAANRIPEMIQPRPEIRRSFVPETLCRNVPMDMGKIIPPTRSGRHHRTTFRVLAPMMLIILRNG